LTWINSDRNKINSNYTGSDSKIIEISKAYRLGTDNWFELTWIDLNKTQSEACGHMIHWNLQTSLTSYCLFLLSCILVKKIIFPTFATSWDQKPVIIQADLITS